ncbi:MAG: ribonuclease P protein component [Patescibacteria group bacterium]
MLAKKFRLQIQNWLKDKGKKINARKSDFFIVKIAANGLNFSRFGVVISRKVSKSAVRRNKIKRTIFDFIRLNGYYKISGKDVLITVLPPTGKFKKSEIENELNRLLA